MAQEELYQSRRNILKTFLSNNIKIKELEAIEFVIESIVFNQLHIKLVKKSEFVEEDTFFVSFILENTEYQYLIKQSEL